MNPTSEQSEDEDDPIIHYDKVLAHVLAAIQKLHDTIEELGAAYSWGNEDELPKEILEKCYKSGKHLVDRITSLKTLANEIPEYGEAVKNHRGSLEEDDPRNKK